MQTSVKILSPSSSRSEYLEFGAMAMLFLFGVIQIGCAFSASSAIVTAGAPKTAATFVAQGTVLAKN